jgi:hypothetical protein
MCISYYFRSNTSKQHFLETCIDAKTEAEVEKIERRLMIFRGSKQYDIDNLKDKMVWELFKDLMGTYLKRVDKLKKPSSDSINIEDTDSIQVPHQS